MKIDRPRKVLASSTTVAVISVISGGGGGFPKSSTLVTAWGGENPNPSLPGASLAGCAAGALFARGAAASKHFKRAAESAIPAHFAISADASPAASARAAPVTTKIEMKASTRICMENSRLPHLHRQSGSAAHHHRSGNPFRPILHIGTRLAYVARGERQGRIRRPRPFP